MDPRNLRLASFNMHGFNNGENTLQDLCHIADVIVVQEHWLPPFNLHKLLSFNEDFDCLGWSAMQDKIQSGILLGRPFGGLGLLVRKNLNVNISTVDVMPNCRCAAVKCVFENNFTLLLFSVYFPCYSNSHEYKCELSDCLGFIEKCASTLCLKKKRH